MNWDAMGAVSEAIGAIGVIVTLVYLAYQISQNTSQLRQNELTAQAAAVNAISIALRENRRSLFESSEMMNIWLKGLGAPEQLDEVASYRFRLAIQNVVDVMWDMHSQTMMTGFAPETWTTNGIPLVRRIMTTPGGRWFWSQYRSTYVKEFRAEVDYILERHPILPPRP